MIEYFIVNEFDRPWSECLAAYGTDGLLYYVHPRTRSGNPAGMHDADATNAREFGITLTLENGVLRGRKTGDSVARYPDGSPRRWQGEDAFAFTPVDPEAKLVDVMVRAEVVFVVKDVPLGCGGETAAVNAATDAIADLVARHRAVVVTASEGRGIDVFVHGLRRRVTAEIDEASVGAGSAIPAGV